MKLPPLDAACEELREALLDRRLMGVWELVRQQKEPATVASLRSRCDLDEAELQRCLDRLVALALVRPLAARGRRRVPGYRVTRQSLVVGMDLSDATLEQQLRDASLRVARTHFEELVEAHGHAGANPDSTWRFASCGAVCMTVEDLREFARRVRALTEFMTLVSGRRENAREASNAPASHHAILLRIEPLRGRVLPMPDIAFEPMERASRMADAPTNELSPREGQIAESLAQGLTRPQIASHLGISINTAATLTKRVYRKLGVRNRYELMARMGNRPSEAPES